jgi:hypothetical protein
LRRHRRKEASGGGRRRRRRRRAISEVPAYWLPLDIVRMHRISTVQARFSVPQTYGV